MRYKLILLLLLAANVAFGQGVYRYKNIEITATSKEGEVISLPNKEKGKGIFEVSDSVITLYLNLKGKDITGFDIENKSNNPIVVRWRKCRASSDNKGYFAVVDPDLFIDDKRTGEQKVYATETAKFYMHSPYFDETFSKKPNEQKAHILIVLVVDDKLREYTLDLMASTIGKGR